MQVWTRDKKICSNRVPDMPLKQTVTPKVSCLYVFDWHGLLIFHFLCLHMTFQTLYVFYLHE